MEDIIMAKNKNHHLSKRGGVWYFEKMVNGKRRKMALYHSVTEARKLRDHYLKEIQLYGDIQRDVNANENGPIFGELAKRRVKITEKRVKYSTFRGYRIAMNAYSLMHFGNTPINQILLVEAGGVEP
jgi:hypothetical protein